MPDSNHRTETIDPEEAASFADESLPPGTVIAERYIIRGVLGRGGYAIVYRAFDERLNVEIALKVLRTERASASALHRFRREVHLPRSVSSPWVVRVFDIGSDGPLSFLTMELVEGESLRDRLDRGALPVEETLGIARAMLEGIAALHAAKIIHRDVKPENVLLAADGVKVGDFGLSRYVDDAKTSTAHNALVGTLRYLPPEQIEGRAADERGDLYSAGLVLFEMLAGHSPFAADSAVGVVINRVKSPAPDVRRFRADTPAWLANVIARLLERDASRRYASATDVIAALDARAAPRPASARRRIAFLAAGTLLMMAIAIGVVAWMRAHAAMQFARIIALPDGGIGGVSRGGAVLWRKAHVADTAASQWALVRRKAGAAPEIAIILNAPEEVALDRVRRLSFLEPQTGVESGAVMLEASARSFPRCPERFYPHRLFATDGNGDGVDEVVTCFRHVPEWPSFVDLYDPRSNRSHILFEGYGQHGLDSLIDVDGDGRKEAILFGYNNGLGWYNAIAVLRLDVPWTELPPDRSPDFGSSWSTGNALVMYALLPRGGTTIEHAVSFDPKTRLFTIRYSPKQTVTLTAEGFLPSDRSSRSPAQRQASRWEAFRHLREARRMRDARAFDVAVAEMNAAVTSAEQAADSILIEVMRKERGEILIAAGRTEEAERVFNELVPHAAYAAETCYDAARAYHVRGDLDHALAWYRRGFTERARAESGKSVHEFLQGMVFVHAERHDWAAAEAEIDRFRATFGNTPNDSNSMYRQFLRWRAGQVPPAPSSFELFWNSTDLLRYWSLEFRHARGEDAKTVLRDVDKELATGSSETQSGMLSLRAELLAQTGRAADARDAAVQSLAVLADDIGFTPIARVHAELVRERAKRITGGS